jgi:hypothetical protein
MWQSPNENAMYRIAHLENMIMPGAFGSSVGRALRQFMHDTLDGLDDMNRAAAEGNALDQIREQLTTLRGVEDVVVDTTALHGLTKNYLAVLVFAAEQLAPETHIQMKHVIIAVNKRYDTDIRARVVHRYSPCEVLPVVARHTALLPLLSRRPDNSDDHQ